MENHVLARQCEQSYKYLTLTLSIDFHWMAIKTCANVGNSVDYFITGSLSMDVLKTDGQIKKPQEFRKCWERKWCNIIVTNRLGSFVPECK